MAFNQHVSNSPVNLVYLTGVVMYNIENEQGLLVGLGTLEKGRKFDTEFRVKPAEGVSFPALTPGEIVSTIAAIRQSKIWAPAMMATASIVNGEKINGYGPSMDEDGSIDGATVNGHWLESFGIIKMPYKEGETERSAMAHLKMDILGRGVPGLTGRNNSTYNIPCKLEGGAEMYLNLVDIFAGNNVRKAMEEGMSFTAKGMTIEHQYKVVEDDKIDLLGSVPVVDNEGNVVSLVDEENHETILTVKQHRYIATPKHWRTYLGSSTAGDKVMVGRTRRVTITSNKDQENLINQFNQ